MIGNQVPSPQASVRTLSQSQSVSLQPHPSPPAHHAASPKGFDQEMNDREQQKTATQRNIQMDGEDK